ncbi:hypothetical protein M0804_000839 [Polistes exclamans]|nr:hypothetical protein M0804_000839 [Polistes exclamans]
MRKAEGPGLNFCVIEMGKYSSCLDIGVSFGSSRRNGRAGRYQRPQRIRKDVAISSIPQDNDNDDDDDDDDDNDDLEEVRIA